MSQELCVSCGENPAELGNGTVPLCARCKALANGNERGVKMSPKPNIPKKSKGGRKLVHQ
jgi:hypothetical protein